MPSTAFRALYQIRKRVKLLSHQRRLLAPPSNLAVHEVEEQTEWHESEGSPNSTVIGRVTETVAHGGEDGHDYSARLVVKQAIVDVLTCLRRNLLQVRLAIKITNTADPAGK